MRERNKKMKIEIKIEGMHCESCVKIIEMELEDKVEKIKVNLASKIASIDFNPLKISEKEIKEIINKAGYKAR